MPMPETKNLHPWAGSLFDTSQAATAVTHLASMSLSDLVHPEDRRLLAETAAANRSGFASRAG